MLRISRDSIFKDLAIWFLISVILASFIAAGTGALADKYFSRAVVGLIGAVGEYDLLFQVRTDLKDMAFEQLRQVLKENFPGSSLRTGVSVAGKTTVFVGFAPQYKKKQVFSNLEYYFHDITGSSGYTLMTEPRLTVSGLPGTVHDFFIREAERIRGVRFAIRDGQGIAVFLKRTEDIERIENELQKVMKNYRLLELRFPPGYKVENAVETGRALAEELAGRAGITYIRDVTLGESSGERQALLLTMAEIKRFLSSYAGQVEITPGSELLLEEGDLLVLTGEPDGKPLTEGDPIRSQDVIVKIVNSGQDGKKKGLIIQGDASMIHDPVAFMVEADKSVGKAAGTVVVDSPKERLENALNEAVVLLEQIRELQELPFGQVLTAAETMQNAFSQAENILSGSGMPGAQQLEELSALFTGIEGQLQTMADTMARLRLFEDRLEKAVEGLEGIQVLVRLGLIPQLPGYYGDLGRQVEFIDKEFNKITESLRVKAKALDDFINRFNPLVQTLLAWKEKTGEISGQLEKIHGFMENGNSSGSMLSEVSGLTTNTLAQFEELDIAGLKGEYMRTSWGIDGLKTVDVNAIVEEIKKIKTSLPQLRDEEIGKTISLLDNYLGGETLPGEKVQLFVNAGYSPKEVQTLVHEFFDSNQVELQPVPAGTIQPDMRNELSRLLQEVKGVIAALSVFILAILVFLLDQAPVLAVLKNVELIIPSGRHGSRARTKALRKILPLLYPMLLGGMWFRLVSYLAGAHIPYLTGTHFAIIGSLLGAFFFATADKFHRLNVSEITAGSSLGFSFTVLMREIIIPAGRPSLLQLLNGRKLVMK